MAAADAEALNSMNVNLPEPDNRSNSVSQRPRTAVRKVPAKIATASTTETSDGTPTPDEEAQWLAELDVVDKEPDLTDYDCDDAEASSPPVFDSDYDPTPFLAASERRQQSEGRQAEHQETEGNDEDPMSRLRGLAAKANTGDNTALTKLREILDTHPEIWLTVGNLGSHAELAMIDLVSEGNLLMVESMRRHIQQLKVELLGANPSPLELLTVQRIVANWLHLQFADRACATADSGQVQTNAWAKRLEMAERRYQIALRSLKLVRQMQSKSSKAAMSTSSVADQDGTANEKQATTDATSASCTRRHNGRHAKTALNGSSNGCGGAANITPKANGKPINRVLAATRQKEPALSTSVKLDEKVNNMDGAPNLPPGNSNFESLIEALRRKDRDLNAYASEILYRLVKEMDLHKKVVPMLVREACLKGKQPDHRIRILDVVQRIGEPLDAEFFLI